MRARLESFLVLAVGGGYLATFASMIVWELDLALICLTVWVTASVAFVYVVLRGEGEG